MNSQRVLYVFVIFVVWSLQGCWTHWLVDGSVRLQLKNTSDVPVHGLAVVSATGEHHVWIPDTLQAGEMSTVYSGDWVGDFRLGVSVWDSVGELGGSCWRFVDLGEYSLDGGSSLALLHLSQGVGSLQLK